MLHNAPAWSPTTSQLVSRAPDTSAAATATATTTAAMHPMLSNAECIDTCVEGNFKASAAALAVVAAAQIQMLRQVLAGQQPVLA